MVRSRKENQNKISIDMQKIMPLFKIEKHCAAFKNQSIGSMCLTDHEIRNEKLVTKKAHMQKLAVTQLVVERSMFDTSHANRKKLLEYTTKHMLRK